MKKILTIGAIAIIIAGIVLLGYPTISDYLMRRNSTRAIENYTLSVAMMNQQDIEQEWAEAQKYNQLLANDMRELTSFSKKNLEGNDLYEGVLDLHEEIGHIEIPKIDVRLPIYHGTDESVLKKGIGHMANTAFPIGSMDSHAVLTGHSGLSEATLFTKLEELEIEDTFYINILDKRFKYRIKLIEVVTPEDTSLLQMERGKSYTTLVTCTPYGINTHRLLVRGEYITREQQSTDEVVTKRNYDDIPKIIGAVTILIISFVGFIWRRHKKRRRDSAKKNN